MKTFLPFLILLACLSAHAAPVNLDELRWKRRIVVLYAPAGTEKTLQRQQQLLQAEQAGLNERDITLVSLKQPRDHPEVAQRFDLSGNKFILLLVGKDGGVKLRRNEAVAPETLFRLIDSMPMRRDEMRENK